MAPRARSPGPGNQDIPEWLKTGVRPEIIRGGGGSFTGFTARPYKSSWAQSTLMQRDERILIDHDDGDPGAYVGNGFSSRSFKADEPRIHAGRKDPLAPASRGSFNKNSSRGNASFNTRVRTRAASAPRSSVRSLPQARSPVQAPPPPPPPRLLFPETRRPRARRRPVQHGGARSGACSGGRCERSKRRG